MNSFRYPGSRVFMYVCEMTANQVKNTIFICIDDYYSKLLKFDIFADLDTNKYNTDNLKAEYAAKSDSDLRTELDIHLGNNTALKIRVLTECFPYNQKISDFIRNL